MFRERSTFERVSDGLYRGELTEDWYQGRGVFGGMVSAILLRAMEREAGADRAPRSLHVAFCAPATAGEAEAKVEFVRRGRYVSQLVARLVRGDETFATASASFAAPRPTAIDHESIRAPEIAEAATVTGDGAGLMIPVFCQHLEFQFGLGHPPFSGSSEAWLGGRCRLAKPTAPDAAMLTALADAWPPAVVALAAGWVAAATVDLTIQFLRPLPSEAEPSDAFYAYEARSRVVGEGYADEVATLYGPDGRPLVSSRQLVAVFGAAG